MQNGVWLRCFIYSLFIAGALSQGLLSVPSEELFGVQQLNADELGKDEEITLISTLPLQMSGIKARDICAGGYHTVVLKEDGTVLQFGLGAWQNEDEMQRGKEIVFPDDKVKILALACGDYHTLALSEDGEIWSWGRNRVALGQSIPESEWKTKDERIPRKVTGELANKRVVSIGAGYEHSIAVTDNGKVYGWGLGDNGQNGFEEMVLTPKQIVKNLKNIKIKQVCCGGHHSVLLSEDGGLFTFGSGSFGRLGNGEEVKDYYNCVPKPVKLLHSVVVTELSCGGDHNLALSNEGKVYAWGWNEQGQLGLNDTNTRHVPKQIHLLSGKNITHLSHGKYGHSFAITDSGKVFGWGWNEFGQLSNGDKDNRLFPMEMEPFYNLNIVKVVGGYKHTVALTADGNVLVLGDNNYGQIGLNNEPLDITVGNSLIDERGESIQKERIGISSAINIRPAMEDAIVALEKYGDKSSQQYFAVYDGHGGTSVVNFVKENLHRIILMESGDSMQEIMANAFRRTENLLSKEKVHFTGSTAVSLIMTSNETHHVLHCANIGDSRAVLGQSGVAIRLSYDHKATDEQEIERLQNAGSFVNEGRVRGLLQVTRAFGDTSFDKKSEVLVEPYFSTTNVEVGKGDFILLASDGLWDAFTDQEAVDFVLSNSKENWNAQKLADELLQVAKEKGSKDNIAIILIKL